MVKLIVGTYLTWGERIMTLKTGDCLDALIVIEGSSEFSCETSIAKRMSLPICVECLCSSLEDMKEQLNENRINNGVK